MGGQGRGRMEKEERVWKCERKEGEMCLGMDRHKIEGGYMVFMCEYL